MSQGLQIFNSAGIKTFDSTTAYGGCVIDIVTLIPNSGSFAVYNTGTQTGYQVKTYPAAANITIVLIAGTPSKLSTSSITNITFEGNTITFPPLDHFTADNPAEVFLVIAT